jgi:hypothetical protein
LRVTAGEAHQLVIQDPVFILENTHCPLAAPIIPLNDV